MPKSEPLATSKGSKTAPQQSQKSVPVKAEAEKVETLVPSSPPALIESNSKAIQNVALPSFLQKSEMPDIAGRRMTGYVGFAHPMSKKWQSMQLAGIEEGMPYLFVDQAFIPAPSLEFFLCRGESYKTNMNDVGKFIHVTRDLAVTEVSGPIIGVNRQTGNKRQWVPEGGKITADPHYICLLIVNLNGRLIPIKGDFRGTKSNGIESCIRAVEAASTPYWPKQSDAHKVSCSFPAPFGRIYCTIRTKRDISKSSGRPFHTTVPTCNPSTVSQMQLLVDHMNDEKWNEILAEANNNFNKRVEFMDDIAENGPTD
jgi:hypothetical protein